MNDKMLKRNIEMKLSWYDRELYHALKKSKEELWVCGGAILSIIKNVQINDIDLYVSEDTNLEVIKNIITENKYKEVSTTPNAITYRRGRRCVQLITCFMLKEAKDVNKYFDFSVCSNAYGMHNNELYINDKEGIMSNHSALLTIKHPLPTIYRLKKYRDKGYTFPSHAELYCSTQYLKKYNNIKFGSYQDFYEEFKADMETVDLLMTDYPDQMWEIWGVIVNYINCAEARGNFGYEQFKELVDNEETYVRNLKNGMIVWALDDILFTVDDESRNKFGDCKVKRVGKNPYDFELIKK